MSTSLQATQTSSTSTGKSILWGAIAGIGGGIAFGILMGIMGMLPMVGLLIGQESAAVGFVVHLLISAFIGATFGLLVSRLPNPSLGITVGAGALYGIVWWVLGALIFMPLMLGMNEMVLQIGSPQWMSLIGHILYGVVTALLLIPLSRRG